MYKVLWIMLLTYTTYANDIKLPISFSSDFEQIITNPKNKVIKYSGNLKFVYPAIVKWSYISPTQKEVCSNAEEITVVDHDLEQVSFYYLDKKFNIAKVLSQAKHYKDNIYVAKYQNKQYTIALDKSKHIQSMAYFDDLDNKVQIVFKHIRYKKHPFSSKVMKCTFPKDYDVIRG